LHPFTVTAQDNRISEIRELIAKGLFPFGRYSHKIKVVPEPHQRYEILPPEIKSLFRHAFDAIPQARPTAENWGVILYDFITKVQKSVK
jgi:DNA-binding helix-hairpin-helix protein with protein kinase domain